ncbi:MAG: tyrosine-type recombinase/integrase [archaeon]
MTKVDIYGKIRNYNFEAELKRINQADISQKNKEIIKKYLDHMLAKNVTIGRAIKLGMELRKLANWFGKDFEDIDKIDVERVVRQINLNSNYKEWTKSDYKKCIKQFFKWLKGDDDISPPEVRWIKPRIKLCDNRLINDIFSPEDVFKIVSACNNKRDKALIMFLYESGGRASEVLGMDIRDYYMGPHCAKARLIGKTGERIIPIVNSMPYISDYLNNRRLREDPNAPLWLSRGTYHHLKRLKYQGFTKIIKKAFSECNMDRKCNPHLFRHSRASELCKTLTEAQMCQYFGWVVGSGQIRTYVHISGRDIDASILKYNGIEIDANEDNDNKILQRQSCPRCNTTNSATSKYCSQCSSVLDFKEALETEEILKTETDKAMKYLMEIAKNPELMTKFNEFRKL